MKPRKIFAALAVIQIVLTMFYAGAQDRGGKVDFSADVMLPVKTSDTNAYSLVGNVIFYHNGAIITCDSAVRYGERRMECFENVIINQDSTYIYGDRAVYNGLTNTVNVFSPLIKVLDGDATLYTREFSFNTIDSIGRFGGGGIMRQGDMRLEAQDGYYLSGSHDMIASQGVQMQDSVYKISSDSVRYNTDEEKAYFYQNTRIWNKDGDFLMADNGSYHSDLQIYNFTKNSYILTKEQEIRADSIWYDGTNEKATMNSNIQIFDSENLSFAFGDYATYINEGGEQFMLTRNPSVASYEEGGDTLYMRGDTMLLHTILPDTTSNKLEPTIDSLSVSSNLTPSDSTTLDGIDSLAVNKNDSTYTDSISADSIATDTITASDSVKVLSVKELRALAKEQKREKARLKREAKRAERAARYEQKMLERREKMLAAMTKDSLALQQFGGDLADTTIKDTIVADTIAMDSVEYQSIDSMNLTRRIVYAFGDVKAYRKDIQMVCDSMVSYSIDSTTHLFGFPLMWSEQNQISSEKAVVYSKNQQIDHVLYTGMPIMAAEVDSSHYNQIKGREITALFNGNDISKVNVNGNAQTYYYMVDDSTKQITGFLVAESSDITFQMSERQMKTISFYTDPTYSIYPMNKIPETQSQLLPDFKWQGGLRPDLKDVFNRTIKESIRSTVETYNKPTFPIMQNIDILRKQLIEREIWRDKEDEISEEAMEFVRDIQLNRPQAQPQQ